ncbi:MAG: transcriptional regulator [Gammaproteobacteria bacterium]|nr:MAG: transcriptional regulator [Gammaproteobacteria bacterium]
MDFPQRLAALRKEKGLTQKVLADQVGVHVMQIRRYEGGASQPTLDVIRRLAIALSVSADTLLFDPEDRGPSDDLRLQFEAVAQFDPEARKVAKAVLDGLILQHQARRLAAGE